MALKVEHTEAMKYIVRQLDKAINTKGMPYRVGVMLLSYPPTNPEYHCRIALGTAMKGAVDLTTARDLIEMAKALRRLTEQLDAFIADPTSVGPLPLVMTDEA